MQQAYKILIHDVCKFNEVCRENIFTYVHVWYILSVYWMYSAYQITWLQSLLK